mgnify:CR=1 FL=1
MNKKEDKNRELILSFYFIPFSISFSIQIFLEGELNHLAYSLKGLQARVFAIIIMLISLYITYNILYRLPKEKGGFPHVKKIWKKLILSPFLYFMIITIITNLIINYIFSKYMSIIIIILMLFICYILQNKFIDDIKDYINQIH